MDGFMDIFDGLVGTFKSIDTKVSALKGSETSKTLQNFTNILQLANIKKGMSPDKAKKEAQTKVSNTVADTIEEDVKKERNKKIMIIAGGGVVLMGLLVLMRR